MTSCSVIYAIFLFLFLCTVVNICADYYDRCLTSEHKVGKCIVINHCPPLLNLLKKRPLSAENQQRLKRAGCGFQGIEPKVCCSLNTTRSSRQLKFDATTSGLLPGLDVCGPTLQERIILGHKALHNSYPWTALLEYEKPNGQGLHCAGALINNRYVLTAAHCVFEANFPKNWILTSVYLGKYRPETNPVCQRARCSESVKKIAIERKILHEQYDPANLNRYHDIALLRLTHEVAFTLDDDPIRPVCLPPNSKFRNNSLTKITISGWGVTEDGFKVYEKHETRMKIKDNAECESKYADQGLRIGENQFCASGENACYGDSGGVLFYMEDNKRFRFLNHIAFGVQSIGQPVCSSKQDSVVYTKVEKYIPWIISKLEP